MDNVITTILMILLAIALMVVAIVGIKYLLRYFLNGVKEMWDLSGQIGPIGNGLFIAIWIFFLPFALVITVIIGWSKTNTLAQNTSANLTSNQSLVALGESVNSMVMNPHKVELYPGAQVSLPAGTWKILREQDLSEQYGTVMLNAILNNDHAYTSLFLSGDTLEPQFIWIRESSDPLNFMQITVVDSRSENFVTESNLDQTREYLVEHYTQTMKIKYYSLKLDQMNISDWSDPILIEQLAYRDKSTGKDVFSYKISLQKKPFSVVFSCTCNPESSDRYENLTRQLAKSYKIQ